jgi:hypothetical protein
MLPRGATVGELQPVINITGTTMVIARMVKSIFSYLFSWLN